MSSHRYGSVTLALLILVLPSNSHAQVGATPSTITVSASDGVYQGTAPIVRVQLSSADAAAVGLDGRNVDFVVDGVTAGSRVTDGQGFAALNLGSLRLNAGPHTVTASFAGDATYAASTGSATFTISRAVPVINWPTPAPIVLGTPLSSVQLNATAGTVPGNMAYSPAAGTVLDAGTHTLTATFTPSDSTNYEVVRATRSLTVRAVAQEIVTGKASFLSAAGVGTLLNFEDQPANVPFNAEVYRARGVTIEQMDGSPIYVGQWAFPQAAMLPPSGTKAISSSFAGVQHTAQFSSVCNTPPSCVLFFNNAASDHMRFTFSTPVKAAGIHVGTKDIAAVHVTWLDADGRVIDFRSLPTSPPFSNFVGLVNASTPIASIVVDNGANDNAGVYFDDLLFVPATAAGENVAAWGDAGSTGLPASISRPGAVRDGGGKVLRAVVALSAGANHSLALHADGTVSAWGQNEFGQLGDGTTISTALAVPVQGLRNIIAIAAGSQHSLALDANGTVWSWGNNAFGQLGSGSASTTPRLSPAPVVVGLNRSIVAIAASDHSLAVAADGTLWAWGNNSNGQLGDNTRTNNATPRVAAGINTARAVAAGGRHSLVLMTDGGVFATGHNGSGQLGNNSFTDLLAWRRIDGLSAVTAISAGAQHSVALRADRMVSAWGSNTSGQLGDGTTTTNPRPVPLPLFDVTNIAAGADHTVAVGEEGIVWAWGSNAAGQLGDRALANSSFPVRVLGPDGNLLRATQVQAGGSHSLSLTRFTLAASLSETALNFPATLVGNTTTERRVRVLNTGDVDLALGEIAVFGDFEITTQDCPAGIARPLAPGDGCLIYVVFKPAEVGVRSGRLTVYSDAGDPHIIALTGEGVNDNTAPTVAFVESPEPVNGWHRADSVTVTMIATDDKSGIESLAYASNGAEPRDEVNEPGGQLSISKAIEIATEGVTTITAFANDAVGNISARVSHTVRIDRTAPAVSAVESPAPSASGWHDSSTADPVSVVVTATDQEGGSTLASITWSAGSQTTTTPIADNHTTTLPIPVSGDGVTTVTYYATDVAGNSSEPRSITVRIDRTPPTLSLPPALVVEATRPDGSVIDYTATADDLLSDAVSPSCSPASGSVFPLGSTTVRCSAVDAAGNRTEDEFAVTVADRTGPSLTIADPSVDAVVETQAPLVSVDVTDLVGVTRVVINGLDATLVSGAPQSGRWTANVPVSLPVTPGEAVTLSAQAFDAAGNSANAAPVVIDSDGISASIDRGRADGADQSGVFSNEFVSGPTTGAIAGRAHWTARAVPVEPGVVDLSVESAQMASGTATFTLCTGSSKELRLDQNGERARVRCSEGTVTIEAVDAQPAIELRKLVTETSEWPSSPTYDYWTEASLASGLKASTGSPIVADPQNTEPITVRLLQVDASGAERVVGTLVLDPGESADVRFVEGGAGQDDIAAVTVLAGRVSLTLAGQTVEIPEGSEPFRAVVDRTAPVIEVANVTAEATSPAGAVVAYNAIVRDAVDASPGIVVTHGSGTLFPLGETPVTVTATDAAGNSSAATFIVKVQDTTAPAIEIASPVATTYMLNQVVTAAYSCSDAVSEIASCSGPVASGLPIDTTRAGSWSMTVTAVDRADRPNTASKTVAYSVGYGIKTLHDDRRAVRAGATIPIRLQLVDFLGVNRSDSGVTLIADELVLISTEASYDVQDAGNANPDLNFRYDHWAKTYIFNLKTTGLVSGVHALYFHVEGDPATRYSVRFQVR